MALISLCKTAVLKVRIKWFPSQKYILHHARLWKVAPVSEKQCERLLLQFVGNSSLVGGMVGYVLMSPSLSSIALSVDPPAAPDFMMALGVLIHLALRIGAWWEFDGANRKPEPRP